VEVGRLGGVDRRVRCGPGGAHVHQRGHHRRGSH
jgi:hypothetical protein